mmetsp:Transcript_22385/g.29022  ORF Transcript_22385/g.29022 Transcript_22385/m.29022 type:complete len:245 (+) Transcript_22385:2-736(+)
MKSKYYFLSFVPNIIYTSFAAAFSKIVCIHNMERTKRYDLQVKLLTIGDSAVGKTSLLHRYANACFSETFIATIGIDFKIKDVVVDGKLVKLQIWDTAGQERFKTITLSYFRGGQGILLVYDVTNRKSFNSIRNWMSQIKQYADVDVNKIIVGNKCDLEHKREVSFEEGMQLAAEYGVQFIEASAKNDANVEKSFLAITHEVTERLMKNYNCSGCDYRHKDESSKVRLSRKSQSIKRCSACSKT